jgi:sugar/nucleoside kinase (ribokinase family)
LQACDAGDAPTASCLCLITPDGQRTMRTCLGAAAHLTSAALLPPGWPQGLSLLHCEGYCLYKPQLAREAMAAAKKAGALVSLDLASFELVANCRGVLQELLAAGLVDLVFANEEEACALAVEPDTDSTPDAAAAGAHHDQSSWEAREQLVEAAQRQLLRHARVAVVSLGARGCVARSSGGQVGRASGRKLQVVDTVGAGDTFTAGFLYGYLHGASLQECAALGCACGSEAVVTRGATLSPASWSKLQQQAQETVQAAAAWPGG